MLPRTTNRDKQILCASVVGKANAFLGPTYSWHEPARRRFIVGRGTHAATAHTAKAQYKYVHGWVVAMRLCKSAAIQTLLQGMDNPAATHTDSGNKIWFWQ